MNGRHVGPQDAALGGLAAGNPPASCMSWTRLRHRRSPRATPHDRATAGNHLLPATRPGTHRFSPVHRGHRAPRRPLPPPRASARPSGGQYRLAAVRPGRRRTAAPDRRQRQSATPGGGSALTTTPSKAHRATLLRSATAGGRPLSSIYLPDVRSGRGDRPRGTTTPIPPRAATAPATPTGTATLRRSRTPGRPRDLGVGRVEYGDVPLPGADEA